MPHPLDGAVTPSDSPLRRPAPYRRVPHHQRKRRLGGALAICALLWSCTSPPPEPHAHDPLTWSAAIGRLDDDRDDSSCSATLVTPDVIATAAHCVILDGKAVDATSLIFRPNLGAAPLPSAQGVKVIAIGKDTKSPGRGENLDVSADWALVRITPPITAVAPIPVGTFTAADIDDRLAKGGSLSQAGYGVYGLTLGQHLYQQGRCQRLDDDKLAANLRDYILFTSCRPIKGDSGGPLLLTEPGGEHYLVGVISQYRFTHESADRVTIAAGALGFVHDIARAD
jgi:protease YdgD